MNTRTTTERTYAAKLKGGYSKYHLVIRGTDRSLCGKIPTWDGWTYAGDVVDESVRRFGDQVLCKSCYRR